MKERNARFQRIVTHPTATFIVDTLFIITSFIISINQMFQGFEIKDILWLKMMLIIIWGASLLLRIYIFAKERITRRDFMQLQKAEELSSMMLKVQQESNAYKTRHVLQITYGSVPKWHPFDYQENVLVYDVHEQIRTLLIELKKAIISTTPDLDSDSVTVDLVYCYPDDDYDGVLPAKNEKESEEWKLITSRDVSSMNYKIHDFLRSGESFYFLLDHTNYVFFNDKSNISRYYIPSGKDQEYGLTGSIVGLSVNVKNDVPESVLVKALLTITTYGRKLHEKDDQIEEHVYKDLFKRNVLNGYKPLIESELAQMYIRHMILKKGMCRHSGAVELNNGCNKQFQSG